MDHLRDHQHHKRARSPHAQEVKRASKRLSWILRHGAGDEGLDMDSAGWVSVEELLAHLKISRALLDDAIAHNNKARFETSGDLIRASQGHSLESMPVDQASLERSWARYEGAELIWHATQASAVESIRQEGIKRGQRSHVHLASSHDSKVGKRSGAPVLIAVSLSRLRAGGHEVFVSSNGVLLTRFVPPECIVSVRDTRSRRARNR